MNEKWEAQTNEQLCVEYQQTKNNNLFEYFLSRNFGLIANYCKNLIARYPNRKDEFLQEGHMAMWEAMNRFDIEEGTKFSTYLYYFLRRNMWHLKNEQSLVRLPINLMGHEDEVIENAPFALVAKRSLDKPINDGNDGDVLTLLDVLADSDEPVKQIVRQDNDRAFCEIINKLKLSYRDTEIIKKYFGLGGYTPRTLQSVGDDYNLTRERVRQIIKKAFKRIRYKYSKEKLLEIIDISYAL